MLRKEKKINFKNNSQYLIPKILEDNSLLNFNIQEVNIEFIGTIGYLNIYYNIQPKKTLNALRYISNKEKNLFSDTLCIVNDHLCYCYKYVIPKQYFLLASMCYKNINILQNSDVEDAFRFCGFTFQLYK